MEILINNKPQFVVNRDINKKELQQYIENELSLVSKDYYLISNGKHIDDHTVVKYDRIHIVPRTVGGKGGFGSMLRAIGAQIEKTTNREACRDLSGRRLRDINEEQRLKTWINQQAEREKEAKDRKKKKLERLCERPRHEFKDAEYDKERSELPDKVEDALLQGLQASCSSKRKATDKQVVVQKKKPKLWVDDDLSSASEDDQSESEETNNFNEVLKNSKSEDSKNSCASNDQKCNVTEKSALNVDSPKVVLETVVEQTANESKGEGIRKEENL